MWEVATQRNPTGNRTSSDYCAIRHQPNPRDFRMRSLNLPARRYITNYVFKLTHVPLDLPVAVVFKFTTSRETIERARGAVIVFRRSLHQLAKCENDIKRFRKESGP